MQNGRSRTDLLPLLRECKLLDTKRTGAGLSPAEHERWLDLKEQLGSKLMPSERERRVHHRAPTRINTSFEIPEAFQEAIISNISHGGVFVSTTHPPDIGTKLTLNLRIESTGVRLDLPCLVVSQNVGANFSTDRLGMGLRFSELGLSERTAIAQLYEEARSHGDA
jgi:uncharacterized protein (TIGR02266 family)